jgi:hypothetical protein
MVAPRDRVVFQSLRPADNPDPEEKSLIFTANAREKADDTY